jgi:hypothetical protein
VYGLHPASNKEDQYLIFSSLLILINGVHSVRLDLDLIQGRDISKEPYMTIFWTSGTTNIRGTGWHRCWIAWISRSCFFVKEKTSKNIFVTCNNGSKQPHKVLASCSFARTTPEFNGYFHILLLSPEYWCSAILRNKWTATGLQSVMSRRWYTS